MTHALKNLHFASALLGSAIGVWGQPSRINTTIDSRRIAALHGNVRPGALRQVDEGRIDRSFSLPAITLLLKSSVGQTGGLDHLLSAQQDSNSPQFHHWLTPEEFADQFGVSQRDIGITTNWLRSRGFTVGHVGRSRRWIIFSGSAGQVEDAFRTEIHRYRMRGQAHFANSTAPWIPEALADVVLGIDGLDDFDTEVGQPEMTSPGGVHTLAPDDLATIYGISPLYQSGVDGTGQKLAVMGTTQFDVSALADVATFRSRFNLPPNIPQVVLSTDFPDPGLNSNSINEAHLDIEWAGAIARNATIIFVYSGTFLHAVLYTVDNNLAPVITMSANTGCEAANTPANMTFYQMLAQQANAQGMTWVNSGSDAGPASCDPNGFPLAQSGLGVRFPASIPEVTAVGGTEFNEQSDTYWGPTNTANGASALSYIPERVWNDALSLNALWAGGGGSSIYFPKPAWQAGPGVPNDSARDLPDVSLAASFSHDGYYVVRNNVVVTTGGTSASAPVFAGMVTLLNQYLMSAGVQPQPGLGNINPMLYRLAAATTGVFHDITVGDNVVPCLTGSSDCPNGTMGFHAGPGYDLASGLGSVDVAQLLAQWKLGLSTANPNAPTISPGGVVPIFGTSPVVQPGTWISIYGANLISGSIPESWSGNYPTALGGTTVTINNKLAYLWYVSPTLINLQAPDDDTRGSVSVVVSNANGSGTASVTLADQSPSFSLLGDGKHVAGIIVRPDGSGSNGAGANSYDILGPTGTALGYKTVAAKPGDTVVVFGVGFGPTNPAVAAGQPYSGSAATATGSLVFTINGKLVTPFFVGVGLPGLFQVNLTVPSGLGTGDQPLLLKASGVPSQPGVVIALQ
jgi:uncharacterized protein (TIGR03437 family)